MEMSSSDCVDLDAASQILATSRMVHAVVKKSVDAARFSDTLMPMKTEKLEGDLGADIYDLLADAIRNDAKEVWSELIRQPHGDYPIQDQ